MFDEFEKPEEKSYNIPQEVDLSQPIQIDMRTKKPINDPKCKHEWYRDMTDGDATWADVWKCKYCPVGHLARKQ